MPIVRVRTEGAQKKLNALRKGILGQSTTEVLESEGRNVALSLARSTQPFGTGGDAKDMGERAVASDIAKVYATVGDLFSKLPAMGKGDARQFWKLVNLQKFDAVNEIMEATGEKFAPLGLFDDGALHRGARNSSRGRVTQKNPSMTVTDPKQLQSYLKKEMDLVGFGKSAWASCARKLGGIRGLRAPKLPGGESDITANWILRHTGQHGLVYRTGWTTNRPRLTMTSVVRYASSILSGTAVNNALRIARDRLMKQMLIAARYEMDKARRAA